jgi:hypothetical protein
LERKFPPLPQPKTTKKRDFKGTKTGFAGKIGRADATG